MAKDSLPLARSEKQRLIKLGKVVREIRQKKGLTLEQVEEAGYPSWKHLQAVESGRKNLTITSLYRLAKALSISPADLISELE